MKKILNKPETFVPEVMEGIVAAYQEKVTLLNGDFRVLVKNTPTKPGKVGIAWVIL